MVSTHVIKENGEWKRKQTNPWDQTILRSYFPFFSLGMITDVNAVLPNLVGTSKKNIVLSNVFVVINLVESRLKSQPTVLLYLVVVPLPKVITFYMGLIITVYRRR